MPDYLSDSCKDLIAKMLIVDPLRRISILDIKYECIPMVYSSRS